jgi:hypothetical protein
VTVTLALPKLYQDVVDRFAAEGTNVPNLFGWRSPLDKEFAGQPRIAWVPGDTSGALGKILAPRKDNYNPRALANLAELVTVDIISSDDTDPESELKQYQVARELYDAWYRAVKLAAAGNFEVVSSAWITDHRQRRHGAGIRVVLAVLAVIPDKAFQVAPADTKARIDVEELDNTETITVPPEEEEP